MPAQHVGETVLERRDVSVRIHRLIGVDQCVGDYRVFTGKAPQVVVEATNPGDAQDLAVVRNKAGQP